MRDSSSGASASTAATGKGAAATVIDRHIDPRASSLTASEGYKTLRDFIAAPICELAFPGVSPDVTIVESGDKKVHTSCDVSGVTKFNDRTVQSSIGTTESHSKARRTHFPKPIDGFAEVIAASILTGDASVTPDNIGYRQVAQDEDSKGPKDHVAKGLRVVKVHHGNALLVRAQTMEDLLQNLEQTFFFSLDSDRKYKFGYDHYVKHGIIDFSLEAFKGAIDEACARCSETEVRRIITERVEQLAASGINFEGLLRNQYNPPVLFGLPRGVECKSLRSERAIPAVKTQEALVDYYVESIMHNRELMVQLSHNLSTVMKKEGNIDPQPMLYHLRLIDKQEQAKKLDKGGAGAAPEAGVIDRARSASGAAAASTGATAEAGRASPSSMTEASSLSGTLTAKETAQISRIAGLIGADLFQSGAQGRRKEDVQRIKEHLNKTFLELKGEGHDIGAFLDKNDFRAMVGKHSKTEVQQGQWLSSVTNPNCLAQQYYEKSQKTLMGHVTGGIELPKSAFDAALTQGVKDHIAGCIQMSATPSRS